MAPWKEHPAILIQSFDIHGCLSNGSPVPTKVSMVKNNCFLMVPPLLQVICY